MTDFRWTLINRRRELNLSQDQVAELAGTYQSRMSQRESGVEPITHLRVSELDRWCQVLGLKLVIRIEEAGDDET